jgi:hypothetical protein
MKVKIHFSKNRKGKLFSQLLQWYEGLPISHCVLEFNLLGNDLIFHSTITDNVSFISKDNFLKENIITETYEIELDNDRLSHFIQQLGIKYGFMQNIGIFIVDIFRKFGVITSNPFKTGKNCSELLYVNILYKYDSDKIYKPDLVKPSEIRKILIKNKIKPTYSIII